MFAIDTSDNVTLEMINKMKNFVREQLLLHNISSAGTRVSLLSYGYKEKVLIPLRDGITRPTVTAALNKVNKIGGERRLHLALKTIRNDILSKEGAVRDKTGNLVIVLIAGANDPLGSAELGREGKALKDAGVKVAVIGIGQNVKDEDLKAVATDPSTISKVQSDDYLKEAVPIVSETAGRAAGNIVFCMSFRCEVDFSMEFCFYEVFVASIL